MSSAISNQARLRISKNMCQLSEVLVAKKEYVSLPQEVRFRNKLVEMILEWNSEFQNISKRTSELKSTSAMIAAAASSVMQILTMAPGTQNADMVTVTTVTEQIFSFGSNTENAKLMADLDLATMKAMVVLLTGLPLQPTAEGPTIASLATIQEGRLTDADSTDARRSLFHKYFKFFLKVLQKCKVFEIIEARIFRSGVNMSLELQSLHQQLSKSNAMTTHLRQLKENTILALSNLLSSNIDIGLKDSFNMGYDEDVRTRSAFMQVLTNILKIGAAAQFEGLAEEGQIMQDRHGRLLDLVISPDMTIVLALCEVITVVDVDELAKVLLNVFESKGTSLRMLEAIVERE
ncbi:Ras GTPase activating protein ira2, partial [Nowakowskiella sp. JEL0078]